MALTYFIDRVTYNATATTVVSTLAYHTNQDLTLKTTTKAALITLVENSRNAGVSTRLQIANGLRVYIQNSTNLRIDKHLIHTGDRLPTHLDTV
jgi:hypothetical protein